LEQDLAAARRRDPESEDQASMGRLQKILERLNNGAEFYIDAQSEDDPIPEIYTARGYIDQIEAERMLIHFLNTKGLKKVGFQWVWPDVIAYVG
jgi:hypothetical protein